MEHVLIGTDDTEPKPIDENGSADTVEQQDSGSRFNLGVVRLFLSREKAPLTSQLVRYVFIAYWVVFALAIWLYYIGTCVGNDCFVLGVYPPIITPEQFTMAMNDLRKSSPGIVNYSFFPFAAAWTITGLTAFYIGFGNWRSNVLFVFSVVAIVFSIIRLMIVLSEISDLHFSITIWLMAPMILGTALIASYIAIWFRLRLVSPEYARQSREFIGAIGAFGAQIGNLHENGLVNNDLQGTTLGLKSLGEFSSLRDRKNEIRERVDEWIKSPILMKSRAPTENSLVESAAALGCLADSITALVSGSYKSVKKVPHVMKMIDELTKTTVMELTFISNEYRTALRSSLIELGSSLDDLGKEHEQGSDFAGKTILANPELIPVQAKDVLLRTDPETWSKFS